MSAVTLTGFVLYEPARDDRSVAIPVVGASNARLVAKGRTVFTIGSIPLPEGMHELPNSQGLMLLYGNSDTRDLIGAAYAGADARQLRVHTSRVIVSVGKDHSIVLGLDELPQASFLNLFRCKVKLRDQVLRDAANRAARDPKSHICSPIEPTIDFLARNPHLIARVKITSPQYKNLKVIVHPLQIAGRKYRVATCFNWRHAKIEQALDSGVRAELPPQPF